LVLFWPSLYVGVKIWHDDLAEKSVGGEGRRRRRV